MNVTDKRVAERRARKILEELENEKFGGGPPRTVRDAAMAPIEQHQRDFLADRRAQNRDAEYIYITGKRLDRLREECGWVRLSDVTPDSFVTWRSERTELAAKTLNEYLAAARAFFAWMKRQRRALGDPLEHVGRIDARGSVRRERRALTIDEAERLVNVAGERRPIYLLALLTGLRRAEIDALGIGDIEWGPNGPATLRVRASTTKNGKAVSFRLRDDLADAISTACPDRRDPNAKLFPRGVPDMDVFRADLAAAKIPERDPLGRRVDFHALRHTMVTNMQRVGIEPRIAQDYARHSDPRLTNSVYTDTSQLPTWEVMDRLPRFAGGGTREGTLGRDAKGRGVSQSDAGAGTPRDSQGPELAGLRRTVASSVAPWHQSDLNSVSTTSEASFSLAVGQNGSRPTG